MANFGVEGIQYFDAYSANSGNLVDNLIYVFNICNGLDEKLRNAGHTRVFYWANNDCWEMDIRSNNFGGMDDSWSDNVDLFFIFTHGRNDGGNTKLVYNVKMHNWLADSSTWRLELRE